MTIRVKIQLPKGLAKADRILKVAIGDVVNQQAARRFDTNGAADGGTPWEPHTELTKFLGWSERPLIRTRQLSERTVAKRPDVTTLGPGHFRLDFSSPVKTESGYNLGAIHQFGVRGPIVPVKAKALFLPINRKEGKSPLGGRKRALKRKVVGGKHVAEVANRRGKVRATEPLTVGQDFLLAKSIPQKSYASGMYAIPPRPFFQVTRQNLDEIGRHVVEAFRKAVT